MRAKVFNKVFAVVLFGLMVFGMPLVGQAKTTITMWSHFADHQGVRAVWAKVTERFNAHNPDAELEISWYDKKSVYAAQMTALRAGAGPDIIFIEPDKMEYVENNFLMPLNDLVNWDRVMDPAREAWTVGGNIYAFPVQLFTVELYYNEDLMKKLGFELPSTKQVDQDTFLEIVKKAKAEGITPIVQGIGDRPYPGSYLVHELLLRKLGKKDYGKLWAGELSFKDPRVISTFNYFKKIVDAGAYPQSFSSLKLGESHYYFHTKPGGLMFPCGSWYTSRAFNAPDKGGQPEDFPLGIMQFPSMKDGAGNNCKSIGVAGSYGINTRCKNPELVAKVFKELLEPDIGKMWLQRTFVGFGVKTSTEGISGKHADYFAKLDKANEGKEFFLGTPIDHIRGNCREVYIQVLNAGLPAGLLDVNEAASMMNEACYNK